ncbi:outer membrane protein transport protein, partial [Brucella sp. 21LCYQ03]|nr:outer membrane protein transport protein [Brucella sp. 21LCYQ03]
NFPDTQFSSELPLPSSLNLGIAFPLGEKVDMAIDGSILNYSIYKQLAFEYETDLIPNTVSEKNYENAYAGRVGINYQVSDRLALRTGVGYVRTPVRGGFVYPETPDNDRMVVSAGVTYDISPKWELNAAYAFQHILPRTTTNVATGLRGRYETYIHAPGVSLSYKW